MNDYWEPLAFIFIGIAALAREQTLLLLPLIYFVRKFSIWRAVLFSFTPYMLLSVWPLFPKLMTWSDGSSGIVTASTSVWESYFRLLCYHLSADLTWRGLLQPISIFLNCGAVLTLAIFSHENRLRLLWILLPFCFVFNADRHMVLLNIPVLLGMSNADSNDRPNLKLRWALISVVVSHLILILLAKNAFWLQVNNWDLLF